MANYADEYLEKISKIVHELGFNEATKILCLKDSSLERAIREAKRRNIFEKVHSSKTKHINKIIESFTEKELEILANGKNFLLEKSKKLDINFNGNHVKIGVFTDTHIGHQKFYDQRIYAAFEEFKKEKVDFLCHCGDITEGMSHHPGHIYELTHLGYDAQKSHTIKLFSQWIDTDIYAISGNHDRWYLKANGANIVKDISKELDNFHFIGHDTGDIHLNDKVKINLWHGEDGNSYALSYRVQKIIESIQGGEKPNVMFCGHTHKYVKIFERNIHAISVGCIEDQTDWMRGKRIPAHTGFGIYDIYFNDSGIVKLTETWYPFY